ncbi:MAG: outer membrane protein assembly factor BamD [Candidatus Omnitrophica bacterium]|nr:outer membrane protein assembly factor BamD [Candidatus Omnitrophota bacterium]
MIKKILIFCIVCACSINAYSFWVWSPKTQKWKNPKYSPLATPFLQFKEGEKNFEGEKFKEAYDAFKKLIIHYPDAQEAAEAQYYLGRCLEELNQPYQAFQEYQKVIDSYPNSKRINEAVEREYKIGEYFLNREPKQWLGVSVYDFVEHPSLEIFKKIVEKVPYSPYATQAEYKLGLLLMKLSRYDEARESFQKVIDNYPDSEWAMPAKYQLAIATSKASPGVGYDSTTLQEASSRLDEFIKKHPDAQISTQAEQQLKELRNKEARKNFDVAQFYENQDKYDSALLYYNVVIDKYADSEYYLSSLERVKELNELIKGNITKKELLRRKAQELADQKKEQQQKIKDDRYLEKEQRIITALEKKQEAEKRKKEIKQQKIEAKKAARAHALEVKQEIRAQKEKERKAPRAKKSIFFWRKAEPIKPSQEPAQEGNTPGVPAENTPVPNKTEGPTLSQPVAQDNVQPAQEPQGQREPSLQSAPGNETNALLDTEAASETNEAVH